MDELKKQAEELGIKVDARWGEERLKDEIAAAVAAKAAADEEADRLKAEQEEADRVAAEEAELQRLADEEARIAAEVERRLAEALDGRIGQPEKPAQTRGSVFPESVTVTSRIENPMSIFGITEAYGSATLTRAQLESDPKLVASLQKAEELGMVKVE